MARIVVMGVSGCGKSSLGAALAEDLGLPFADADDFHPPANIAKMAAGIPLTDDDRWPWLDAIGAWLAARPAGIAACSALRRAYRDHLRGACPGLRFLHPSGAPALIEARQAARPGHFMPPSLMASQFATLEPPGPDEGAITLDIARPLPDLVARARAALAAG
ncbi:MAG: gluconokinase [Acetobacteraceae bacterium]|nr:gluconokinase [Acetobacteraceae bacterium]